MFITFKNDLLYFHYYYLLHFPLLLLATINAALLFITIRNWGAFITFY